MTRAQALVVAVSASTAVGFACNGPPKPALEGVLFAGCEEITASGRCRIEASSSIKVWVPAAKIEGVRLGAESVTVAAELVQDGLRFAVPVSRLPVRLSVSTAQPAGRWALDVQRYSAFPELARAQAHRRANRYDEAYEALVPALESANAALSAHAYGLRARVAIAEGNLRRALRDFETSIDLHERTGSVSSEVHDRFAMAYVLRLVGDFSRLHAVVEPVSRWSGPYPAGVEVAQYYRMMAAVGTHDYRRAVSLGKQALKYAARIDDRQIWRAASVLQIDVLRQLGRNAEARALLDEIGHKAVGPSPCARAMALGRQGRLLASLADDPASAQRAKSILQESIRVFASKCKRPRQHAYAMAILGQLELRMGQPARAEALLAQSRARQREPGGPLAIARTSLEADLALYNRRFRKADNDFEKMRLQARLFGLEGYGPRTFIGQGQAREAMGRLNDAIAAYRASETALERLSFRAPLGGGRETFLGARSTGAQHLIDLLLKLGRIDEAASAARRSRIRALRAVLGAAQLEGAPEAVRQQWYEVASRYRQRQTENLVHDGAGDVDDWALSVETLRAEVKARRQRSEADRKLLDEAMGRLGASLDGPMAYAKPRRDELFLLYHRAGDSWAGFAIRPAHIRGQRIHLSSLDEMSPAELAERLLGPFAKEISEAARAHILVHGQLNRVDFHALPWRGRPLVASVAVSYGLDFPRRRSFGPDVVRRALVADPTPELTATADEAQRTATLLRRNGWRVQRLSVQTTRAQMLQQLRDQPLGLFHYAGHAYYGGFDGWESHLGRRTSPLLRVPDILTLPRAPVGVVLSGCETAADSANPGASGLGLAQAFVLSGSDWVIASVRKIKDTDAHTVARTLYEEQRRAGHWDAAVLLSRAQARLADDGADVDWASVRVLTR